MKSLAPSSLRSTRVFLTNIARTNGLYSFVIAYFSRAAAYFRRVYYFNQAVVQSIMLVLDM